MIIKTKDFKEAANKILLAANLDTNAANLELAVRNSSLYLNVTNKEYYVAVKFPPSNWLSMDFFIISEIPIFPTPILISNLVYIDIITLSPP